MAVQMLLGVTSRFSSKQHVAFFYSSHLAFSPYVLLASIWCIHTVVLTQSQIGKNPVLFYLINQTSI